jgi:2-dehydro-3-deoxyphosphogluconate aldolase/(4S)-4-hydroxy-2-oxoglutarate aldolase
MKTFPAEMLKKIKEVKIIATVTIDELENAVPLARTLWQSGIRAMELTLRTNCALQAIETIRKEFPDMMVGAGTVIFKQQVRDVMNAGVHFAVAPGTNSLVIEEAQKLGLPFAPGIATPSDIELAVNLDCRILKYFPAEKLGGITYLDSITQPYQHLGLQFIPLGGIGENNMNDYINHPLILAIGGSWIATKMMIDQKDWESILTNGINAINAK